MIISFEKWHGGKNDFIVTEMLQSQTNYLLGSLQRHAPRMCTKDGSGIGADGLLILSYQNKESMEPSELFIINRDGSLAKNCGNGLRCAAAFAYQRRQRISSSFEHNDVSLQVMDKTFYAQVLKQANHDQEWLVQVDMPKPLLNEEISWFQQGLAVAEEFKQSKSALKVNQIQEIIFAEVGNPHVLIFTENWQEDAIYEVGPFFQKMFAGDGINVHLVQRVQNILLKDSLLQKQCASQNGNISESLSLSIWERGVGVTPACGSGASAAASFVFSEGFLMDHDWVHVAMPGGDLLLNQRKCDEVIRMMGKCQKVFSGQVDL